MSFTSAAAASSTTAFLPPFRIHPHSRFQTLTLRRRPPPIRAALSDPLVLKIADRLEDSLLPSPSLQPLRDSAATSLLSTPWPSPKDEPFRFTDTSFIKSSDVFPSSSSPSTITPFPTSPCSNHLLIVDGHLTLSNLPSLQPAAFAGPLSSLPPGPRLDRVLSALSTTSRGGDLFSDLNSIGAPDVTILYIPSEVRMVDEPVHLLFCVAEGADAKTRKMPLSNPRVLVVVEKGAEVAIVEEHLGIGDGEDGCYWANSVTEIVIEEGGRVSHSYVQQQSLNAAHIKWTFVRQEASSTYELIEICTGGKLSRHNLHIQQMGPDTVTELSTFHVSQSNQTQDLHSRLILDHPRGLSRQLHKCIVSHSSGHAIFDGNVMVNRYAQQTDAGQLTRTLLLAPRATANLKPNLQIIADDVKCSHGAAISDLEEDQLFYFQARGIDQQTARDALLFSFGAEVLSKIPFEPIRKSVSSKVKNLLVRERRDC